VRFDILTDGRRKEFTAAHANCLGKEISLQEEIIGKGNCCFHRYQYNFSITACQLVVITGCFDQFNGDSTSTELYSAPGCGIFVEKIACSGNTSPLNWRID
jgi:hypothetical protein